MAGKGGEKKKQKKKLVIGIKVPREAGKTPSLAEPHGMVLEAGKERGGDYVCEGQKKKK